MDLSDEKIVIVTGKGGVGKSAVAAGIALAQSKLGKRVLLVEFAERSYYQRLWKMSEVSYEGSEIRETWSGLSHSLWSGSLCLREYVENLLPVKSLLGLFFNSPVMKAFMDAAPALADVSLLGKLTSEIRNIGVPMGYDLIVVDGYSSGHALALLRSPMGLAEAINVGPMGRQSRDIHNVMTDAKIVSYVIVSLPEELPSSEALELGGELKKEWGISPVLVENRMMRFPDNWREQIEGFELGLRFKNEFFDYLKALEKKQIEAIDRVEGAFSQKFYVPWVFENDPYKFIEKISESFSRDLKSE